LITLAWQDFVYTFPMAQDLNRLVGFVETKYQTTILVLPLRHLLVHKLSFKWNGGTWWIRCAM